MNDRARISIITPTRNRLALLKEAVASVQDQSFEDWELIVVDDDSQDDTWCWLQSLEDERIRALRLEQHGERAVARNAGLAAARGEYVLFLDDDDWLLDDALLCLFESLRRHPAAVAAIGAYIYENNWGSWNRGIHPRRRVYRNIWTDILFGWVPFQGQSLLRRSAIVELGGWNETLGRAEDNELWLRLARIGPAVLIPQNVFVYRQHPGQTNKTGGWTFTVKLRQAAAKKLSSREAQAGERLILAHRMVWQAWRALERGRAWQALGWWWKAVTTAPKFLFYPIARPTLTTLGRQCLTHVILNDRLRAILRTGKRACIRAYRGELRSPALANRTAKAVRTTDGRP